MKSLHQCLIQICSNCLIHPREEVFPEFVKMKLTSQVYSLNPAGLQGIDPSGLEHFLVGD